MIVETIQAPSSGAICLQSGRVIALDASRSPFFIELWGSAADYMREEPSSLSRTIQFFPANGAALPMLLRRLIGLSAAESVEAAAWIECGERKPKRKPLKPIAAQLCGAVG